MKEDKPNIEGILFTIVVILSLIGIVYCFISTAINSYKESDFTVEDTLFQKYIPGIQMIKSLPDSLDGDMPVFYELTSYSEEGIVQSVNEKSITIRIGEEDREISLFGIDIKRSADLKKRLVKGESIYIQYNSERGAFLFFEDGTMIQHWLLLAGLATVSDEEFPEKNEFEEIQKMAVDNKAGIWE